MLTIDIELEKSLLAVARQEHCSLNETIQILLNNYLKQYPEKNRFIQKQSITQSLTGLLANANVEESDYHQHLLRKHL
ncbi:MAG: hypothetical protein ACXW1C_05640 [Gallionella sp.]